MRLVVILLLGAIATLGACTSPGNDAAQASATRCVCGTPEADFEGCAHAACMKGTRNPDNPDCVCGPMQIGGKQ